MKRQTRSPLGRASEGCAQVPTIATTEGEPLAIASERPTDTAIIMHDLNRPPRSRIAMTILLIAVTTFAGCAHNASPRRGRAVAAVTVTDSSEHRSLGDAAARQARSMVGTSYHYGGSTPSSGFDCSGLVVYSFGRAGQPGLPHSVARLDDLARPISIEKLEAGDLLFFRLQGRKNAHVGIYLGDRRFVHSPSSGKKVEVVSFDHVYWGPRIKRAGRLIKNH
ncbi:MAG TPA: peptidoglycan endopeptidase [Myxococcales bacterium]|nr:peptidoglycan endopeptidase [Myxococcales bacterium]HIK83926.1 peptidoglycan endopeptidase [Myxococcales bacterium]